MKHFRKRIQKLQKLGFAIRLPGGKSRDGSSASFGGILKYQQINKKYEIGILVIPYNPHVVKRGGDEERVFPETSEQTLEREIQEETGILINKANYFLTDTFRVPDNRTGYEHDVHTKSCFAIYSGYDVSNIRTRPSLQQPSLGTPLWVPFKQVDRYIDPRHLWMIASIKQRLPYIEKEITHVPTAHPER